MIIGILGHGSIGKRHATNAAKLGHDTLIYDPETCSPAARNTVMRESDAIVIATPTQRHCLDILDCVEQQKPMLIEKPITHPVTATLNLVTDRLAISGVPAFVGFNLRFHEAVKKAKEWMPIIGTPYRSYFSVLQKCSREEYLRDGVISNWMSHEIDLALWLLGPGTVAECEVDSGDSIAELVIHHEPYRNTCIQGDYRTEPEVRAFTISGEVGQIKTDLVLRQTTCWADLIPTETYCAKDSFDENYKDELSSWIDQIQGKDGLCADWQQGVAVERIVIAARELGGLS